MHFCFWKAMERAIHSLRCVHFHFVMSLYRVQLILKMHSRFWKKIEVYTPTLYCATIINFESALLFFWKSLFLEEIMVSAPSKPAAPRLMRWRKEHFMRKKIVDVFKHKVCRWRKLVQDVLWDTINRELYWNVTLNWMHWDICQIGVEVNQKIVI